MIAGYWVIYVRRQTVAATNEQLAIASQYLFLCHQWWRLSVFSGAATIFLLKMYILFYGNANS